MRTLSPYNQGIEDLDMFIYRVVRLEVASRDDVRAVPYLGGTVVRTRTGKHLFFNASTPAKITVSTVDDSGRTTSRLGQIPAQGDGPGAHPEMARYLREFLGS